MAEDLRKIVEAEKRIFGELPYDRYVFILHHVPEGGGGLEHRNSTALQYPPYQHRPREKYENFLELAAHEFFHLWNVKRIRPEMLGPFDYVREVHTRLLWVMEGITSYYDTLIVTRAKLAGADRYLKKTSERIRRFEEKPGRRRQSLSASSFDAWIGLYQPNENAANCQMSYYEKGELVGMCLDLEIRRRTSGRKSLDDVMRLLWREWGRKDRGFPEGEFRRACERTAGGSLAAFWKDLVDGTAEIPWNRYLGVAGVEWAREPEKPAEGEAPRAVKPWLGASFQKSPGGMTVMSVVEGGPAWKAGLSVRDEVVALDGLRAGEDLERRLDEAAPGTRVRLSFFRSGILRELVATPGRRDAGTWSLKRTKSPTPLQKRIYEGWLGCRWGADRR
jgi:predicted metalloprotease with PDZ domain